MKTKSGHTPSDIHAMKELQVQYPDGPRVLYWFRTDLRLHDSPALHAALALNPHILYPIWTWDPHYVYHARVGPNRWQFLLDSQAALSAAITALNSNSRLLVLREAPQTLFKKLFKAWGITHLVYERDTDAYALERDEGVMELAREMGVQVLVENGRTLFDIRELVKANGGKPTMSITQVQNAAKKGKLQIEKPVSAPTSEQWPDLGDLDLGDGFEHDVPDAAPDFNEGHRTGAENTYSKGIKGPNGDFGVPTMHELGMPEATTPHRGGEDVALQILDKVIADEDFTATFSKPNTAPTAFEPQSTCLTSPHLHFGTLSVRLFWHRVQEVLDRYKGKASEPPTSLHGQLLFRDMYFGAQYAQGYKFAQTVGNSHCRFVPWHLPSKVHPSNGLITGSYEIDSEVAESHFQRWKAGRTGFPWIDALMRQLRFEGWIHHLGRHAVACFLTRGGCYIHWERGAEVFEEWLIDHETACNSGNWQWLSCTAFYAQFYRCYSPVAFGKKWDPEGKFVRRYVPELRELDKKYIYEPWKTPLLDQKKAGVTVKGDGSGSKGGEIEKNDKGLMVYPKPMFDFAERREVCIEGLKKAYKVGLYGDHPKVKNGTWKELFPDDGEGPTEGTKGGPGGTTGEDEHEHEDDEDEGTGQVSRTGDITKNTENTESPNPYKKDYGPKHGKMNSYAVAPGGSMTIALAEEAEAKEKAKGETGKTSAKEPAGKEKQDGVYKAVGSLSIEGMEKGKAEIAGKEKEKEKAEKEKAEKEKAEKEKAEKEKAEKEKTVEGSSQRQTRSSKRVREQSSIESAFKKAKK